MGRAEYASFFSYFVSKNPSQLYPTKLKLPTLKTVNFKYKITTSKTVQSESNSIGPINPLYKKIQKLHVK